MKTTRDDERRREIESERESKQEIDYFFLTNTRLCHSPLLKAYCVLTVNTHFEKGEEVETNMIKLINDQTFESMLILSYLVLSPF